MKIAHVVRQFTPGIGGLENFVEHLALQQVAAGHQVQVITLNRLFAGQVGQELPRYEMYRGVQITRIPFWGSNRYPIALSVRHHLKGVDVIHVHAIDFFFDFLALTNFVFQVPLVVTTHGGYFHSEFGRLLKKAYFLTGTRLALSRYSAVVTCGPNDTRTFRRLRREGLIEIGNAVDIDKFAHRANRHAKRVIYFGRLSSNKKISALLRWFWYLKGLDAEWKLTIAGAPYDVDPADIESEVGNMGLAGATELHVAPHDDELGDLIAQSSVFACASGYEGFGLAAVEAASAGLFPVLNDIEPFRNTISRLGYGMIVDFSDHDSIRKSVERLPQILSEHQRDTTSQKIDLAARPFSWQAAARKYEEVYRGVLGREVRRIGLVSIDVFREGEAIRAINRAVVMKSPKIFAFANAHTINTASTNPELIDALDGATVFNDGVGVDIASKLMFGCRFPENLNGTDLLPKVLSSFSAGTSVFLIGSSDAVVRTAASVFGEKYPHLTVAGCHSGFFEADSEAQVLDKISRSDADVVLAGMGQPKQEVWAKRSAHRLGIPIVCVGAFFDFTAGAVVRAPDVWRRLRIEWAFRLVQEPRRLARRYLVGNVVFLGRVFSQFLRGNRV